LPVFEKESSAIAALNQFISHHELMARTRKERNGSPPAAPDRLLGRYLTLNEAESLDVLQTYGVPVVPHVLCHAEDEAVAAWRGFGGKVAVKGCSSAVTHKSDLGLVFLNVESESGVRNAYRQIATQAQVNGIHLDGVIIAPMVPGGRRELIVGAHNDPTFGPVIAIGDGGKYVEVLPDTRILMANASRSEILRAFRSLRIGAILEGVRGEKPTDLEALCNLVQGVSACITDPNMGVQSLDLNPVIVMDEGCGCAAVDAVVVKGEVVASRM
jgi:acyl-CoA synthetase (NDP forming)